MWLGVFWTAAACSQENCSRHTVKNKISPLSALSPPSVLCFLLHCTYFYLPIFPSTVCCHLSFSVCSCYFLPLSISFFPILPYLISFHASFPSVCPSSPLTVFVLCTFSSPVFYHLLSVSFFLSVLLPIFHSVPSLFSLLCSYNVLSCSLLDVAPVSSLFLCLLFLSSFLTPTFLLLPPLLFLCLLVSWIYFFMSFICPSCIFCIFSLLSLSDLFLFSSFLCHILALVSSSYLTPLPFDSVPPPFPTSSYLIFSSTKSLSTFPFLPPPFLLMVSFSFVSANFLVSFSCFYSPTSSFDFVICFLPPHPCFLVHVFCFRILFSPSTLFSFFLCVL